MKVAVSILSSDYSEEETILKINETDAEYVHVDVMDGHFVKSITNYEHLNESKKPFDVHLMVSRPFEYISKYASLPQTEFVTIHVEIEDNLHDLLDYIKSRGLKCGLAVNPDTPLERLEPYYSEVDQVLIMTVVPGKGGQKMIESVIPKIEELVRLREENGYKYIINVDGGVNGDTVEKVIQSDMVVSGSFVCKSEDYQGQIKQLRLSKGKKKC